MKVITMDMSGSTNKGAKHTGLRDVGNILSLREAIDPQLRITKYIRSYLATVDIIPVEYLLKLNVLNKKNGGWAVEYDYETGIEKYKNSYKIIYNCTKCHQKHKNIMATDDDFNIIIKLSNEVNH